MADPLADGHTSSFARRVVIADDPATHLHGGFEKGRKTDIKKLRTSMEETISRRSVPAEEFTDRLQTSTYGARSGLGRNESVLYTYTHETGHQVYFRAGSPAPPKLKNGRGPTGYADTNSDELFAESFSAYVTAPEALRKFDDGLFRWVEGAYDAAMKNAGVPL